MKFVPKMWPLECSQGFSMIWPTDLVFDPTWPIFELDRDIVKTIILSKFDDDWAKTVASRVFARFSHDLTHWPSFWPAMIQIQFWPISMKIGPKLWPLECSKGFSMKPLTYWPRFLTRDDPYSILAKFDKDWAKTVASRVFTKFFHDLTYWPSFWPGMIHIQSCPSLMKIGPKLWLLECSQGFSMIWPTDLVFDQRSPIFELVWDIVKTIIPSKFDEVWTKTLVSRVFTRFFHDLTYWPSFWPRSPIFELNWDIVRMIILSKFDEDWTKNVASRVFTRFFHDLTYWPSFWSSVTHIRTWLRYCQDDHSEQVWWNLYQKCGL